MTGYLGWDEMRTYAHGEGSAKVVEGYPGAGIAGVVHDGAFGVVVVVVARSGWRLVRESTMGLVGRRVCWMEC